MAALNAVLHGDTAGMECRTVKVVRGPVLRSEDDLHYRLNGSRDGALMIRRTAMNGMPYWEEFPLDPDANWLVKVDDHG